LSDQRPFFKITFIDEDNLNLARHSHTAAPKLGLTETRLTAHLWDLLIPRLRAPVTLKETSLLSLPSRQDSDLASARLLSPVASPSPPVGPGTLPLVGLSDCHRGCHMQLHMHMHISLPVQQRELAYQILMSRRNERNKRTGFGQCCPMSLAVLAQPLRAK
jgi:hypothetical protein